MMASSAMAICFGACLLELFFMLLYARVCDATLISCMWSSLSVQNAQDHGWRQSRRRPAAAARRPHHYAGRRRPRREAVICRILPGTCDSDCVRVCAGVSPLQFEKSTLNLSPLFLYFFFFCVFYYMCVAHDSVICAPTNDGVNIRHQLVAGSDIQNKLRVTI